MARPISVGLPRVVGWDMLFGRIGIWTVYEVDVGCFSIIMDKFVAQSRRKHGHVCISLLSLCIEFGIVE